MAEFTTQELLDVPPEVFRAIANNMTGIDMYKLYVAIINLRQEETKDHYLSEIFKYRAKSIKFYERRIAELS